MQVKIGRWLKNCEGKWVWRTLFGDYDSMNGNVMTETVVIRVGCDYHDWSRYRGFVHDYMFCNRCNTKRQLTDDERA